MNQDSRAQGRGRIARIHRRLLVIETEKRIMQYQSYIEEGRDKDAETVFGLLIYSLERLYRVVEKPARATDDWDLVKQDLIELGRPQQQTSYKLMVTYFMKIEACCRFTLHCWTTVLFRSNVARTVESYY
ncbi:unnamed protein product [Arabidopsis halleri]